MTNDKQPALKAFTPGPWEAIKGVEQDDEMRCCVAAVRGEYRYVVATIENGAPGDYCDTEFANARLIAAAPELYEALEIAAGLIGGPTSFAGLSSDDEVEHTVRVRIDDVLRFRAALAKARGEP